MDRMLQTTSQATKVVRMICWEKDPEKREIVCVSERHRQRETEREKERERQNVCRGMLSSSFLGYFEKSTPENSFLVFFNSFLKSLKSFFVQIWMNLNENQFCCCSKIYFPSKLKIIYCEKQKSESKNLFFVEVSRLENFQVAGARSRNRARA